MPETAIECLRAENKRLTEENETLRRDLHVVNNAKTYYMKVAQKSQEQLRDALSELNKHSAVGERGHACVSIDGGNL